MCLYRGKVLLESALQVFLCGYLCTLLSSAFPHPRPISPALLQENHPHSMRHIRPYSTVGVVLNRWWKTNGFQQKSHLELRPNTLRCFRSSFPEERRLSDLCCNPESCSVVFSPPRKIPGAPSNHQVLSDLLPRHFSPNCSDCQNKEYEYCLNDISVFFFF